MLVADSGSTKTDWRLSQSDGRILQFATEGFNPYYVSTDAMVQVLRLQLLPQLEAAGVSRIDQVYFYGAGCANEEKCSQVAEALREGLPVARTAVYSDLLGAARALCGNKPGIAAILGTGSNSCFYDGELIAAARPSLGYVLGDEGSGAHLGKQLLRAFLYEDMPADLAKRMKERFDLDKASALENIYRRPLPNRYLASFAKFIYQNIESPFMSDLAAGSFRAFFDTHICRYENYRSLKFNCTGSVGFYFSNILRRVSEEKGIAPGIITETPIAGLALYHFGE